jgi:hypothetical protein
MEQARKERNRLLLVKKSGILFWTVFLFSSFYRIALSDASSVYGGADYQSFADRYRLYGLIGISYERNWTTGSDSLGNNNSWDRFTHTYDFGLDGFAVDKRLLTFTVRGLFSQEFNNPGNDITSYGFSTSISLLNQRIKTGTLKYFPQPIQLRFSYFKSRDFDFLSYGVSLEYSLPEKPSAVPLQVPQPEQDQGQGLEQGQGQEKITPPRVLTASSKIPLPTFFLDYDRYDFTNSGQKTNTDSLSLRAIAKSLHAEYTGEYTLNRYDSVVTTTNQTINLEANYFYSDPEVRHTNLTIYNRLYMTDFDTTKSLLFRNTTTWTKNLGPDFRDTLTIGGWGDFFTSQGITTYDLGASGMYSKIFSERFANSTNSTFTFGKGPENTLHSEALANTFTYRLSRIFTFTNYLLAGFNQSGGNYAFSAGISTNTAVAVFSGYTFSSVVDPSGRTSQHSVNFDLNGSPFGNVFLASQNSYTITDISGDYPAKEKRLSLKGDAYWGINRFAFNLGAYHIRIKQTDGQQADVGSDTVFGNIATYLAKRMYFNLSTSYSRNTDGANIFQVHPLLGWYMRKLSMTAEYEMRKTSGNGRDETDHRIFFRATRYFSELLRQFL